MEITQVTVSYARTESLSNYCNIKPGVTLTATVQEGDDSKVVRNLLFGQAMDAVHQLVDDARERDGMRPKFYKGTLYRSWYNANRNCVVLAPETAVLPNESNWKYVDHWHSRATASRAHQARENALERTAEYPGCVFVDCSDGNFDTLPALPDAGPEPAWNKKAIGNWFGRFGIDEALWEQLAQLEHVNDGYLHRLWIEDAEERLTTAELIDFIRENKSQLPPIIPDKADRDMPEGK